MENYKGYFKKHYKYTFTQKDIDDYCKWMSAQYRFINNNLNIDKSKNILEIGSGFGGWYNILDKPNQYEGIEVDKEVVNESNLFFKTNVFKNSRIEDLNTKNRYKYIFAFEVLEHLENPSLAVKNIYNLLDEKQESFFIGTTPYPYKKNILADDTHVSVLHPLNWERIFKNNRFSDVKLYPMTYLPYLWRINKNLNFRIPLFLPFKNLISTCLVIAKK